MKDLIPAFYADDVVVIPREGVESMRQIADDPELCDLIGDPERGS